jgi:hypothetical protein
LRVGIFLGEFNSRGARAAAGVKDAFRALWVGVEDVAVQGLADSGAFLVEEGVFEWAGTQLVLMGVGHVDYSVISHLRRQKAGSGFATYSVEAPGK